MNLRKPSTRRGLHPPIRRPPPYKPQMRSARNCFVRILLAFAHNSLQLTRKKTPTNIDGMATGICNV